jgi:hypothetical protein
VVNEKVWSIDGIFTQLLLSVFRTNSIAMMQPQWSQASFAAARIQLVFVRRAWFSVTARNPTGYLGSRIMSGLSARGSQVVPLMHHIQCSSRTWSAAIAQASLRRAASVPANTSNVGTDRYYAAWQRSRGGIRQAADIDRHPDSLVVSIHFTADSHQVVNGC